MLLGSHPAKIDEKFRLKVPARFRRDLAEIGDGTYYVTSDDGRCAQIFPLTIWERIAQKLQAVARTDPSKRRFQTITSLFGLLTEMDPQGRILIPQLLRESAKIQGDVVVIGTDDHLEVWNNETILKDIRDNPLTDQDRERLAALGI